MARIFSTNFNYRNLNYTAVVTIIGNGEDGKITVRLPDETLHNVLPGGRVTLDNKKRIIKDGSGCSADKDLIEAIIAALNKYEHSNPVRDLWN